MIRPLRQRHRRIFAALGVLLPIAFAAGIAARKTVPTANSLSVELANTAQRFEAIEWKRADLFAKNQIEVHLVRERTGAGQFAVGFSAPKDFAKPDLIVYWVAGNPSITETLPDGAMLLGAFNSSALPLPDDATKTAGVLVLYSLADHEVIEVSKPFRIQKP